MRWFLIFLVRAYQVVLWPLRKLMPLLGGGCRFHPSCSQYAAEALRQHGAWRGTLLALKRLAKCQPWGPSGFDPVPPSAGFIDSADDWTDQKPTSTPENTRRP
ncbi:MAG: membrane protein insertion efficiency factor YidD [Opitutales bacterium]